jgi:hypothetical protein
MPFHSASSSASAAPTPAPSQPDAAQRDAYQQENQPGTDEQFAVLGIGDLNLALHLFELGASANEFRLQVGRADDIGTIEKHENEAGNDAGDEDLADGLLCQHAPYDHQH